MGVTCATNDSPAWVLRVADDVASPDDPVPAADPPCWADPRCEAPAPKVSCSHAHCSGVNGCVEGVGWPSSSDIVGTMWASFRREIEDENRTTVLRNNWTSCKIEKEH